MHKIAGRLMVLSLMVFGFYLAAAHADEEKIGLDKVPKVVIDAVKARFAGAKLVGADKETDKGKVAYEIAIEHKDQKIEVTVTPEGMIFQIEKLITYKDLPKVVSEAVESKYPKAKAEKVEEVIKVKDGQEKLEYYELVLGTAQAKTIEVTVSPQGKILNEEDQSKEKKETKKQ